MSDGATSPDPGELLAWYDRHARALPWRVPPGAAHRADPYRVWLSEIMLQQTTVPAVKPYFERFLTRWPDVAALAAAEDAEVMAAWAGLGYYARARNLLKCARVVAGELGGVFPDTAEGLRALPGIGPYTAGAIAAIAFGRPEPVVDGNVERVMARLYDIAEPLPGAKASMRARAAALTPEARPGDYAQAVMDLGATICTPRSPACGICPWREPCLARARGTQGERPVPAPKKGKPTRFGIAYAGLREDGLWLLETRPAKGLLGGMLGWPGSDWAEGTPEEAPPAKAGWQDAGAEARHTFTHFHLRLQVRVAHLPLSAKPARGSFQPLDPASLPTVMRKVHAIAAPALRHD
ncbi:A/G-specific adenine glycosylase [Pseudoroseicyclus sp. CXY001]|uniref:A/G-specific adenine glycosylase n=1 Tax=Pseudoroseicyclus sp. CXY001 TaxID=3242492 RepID=UPI003570D66E